MFKNFHLRSDLVYKRAKVFMSGSGFSALLWIATLLILSLVPSWVGSAQEGIVLDSLSPQQGVIGTEVKLRLEGRGFSDLVDIQRVEISAVQVPVIRYDLVSEQVIEVTIQIQENVPLGPTEISFVFFEDLVLDHYFEVLEPDSMGPGGDPQLYGIFPREGELGSEVSITLEGEGFEGLGELVGVAINDIEVPILEGGDFTNQLIEVIIFIGDDVPVGEGEIAFFFENWEFFEYFYVFEADTSGPVEEESHIHGIFPQEAELGSEVSLTLEGDGFDQLEELDWVEFDGVELPLLRYDFISNEVLEVDVFIPEDAPTGEGEIAFIFENFVIADFFLVSEPGGVQVIPPIDEIPDRRDSWLLLIGGVVGVAVIGLVLWRALRPRPPKTAPASPAIHFKVSEDPGLQGIETPFDSLRFDVDIRFEVSLDQGEQGIEEGERLTD